jgi:hypothetical protein
MKGMLVPIVIVTLPGTASDVALRLMPVEGLSLREDPSGSRLEGIWRPPNGRTLEELLLALVLDPAVVGVYPGAGSRGR